ncbi:MAG: heme o synthase [Gemmatimonadota bacterium]|nr:heme o synthase [Gemmatimonadota bacterium]
MKLDQPVSLDGMPAAGSSHSLVADLIALTKPRIISLLLLTTIAAMYVAGTPSGWLVVTVLVGGYLMAGGAHAVNMYLDHDIDAHMPRTKLRPIPSGRMSARSVLAFGILLSTAATFLLARFANLLTAAMALLGFYGYVFLYTHWLKRRTPQNIVIGGAAGAIPPLVGYAAVSGNLDLTAWTLFLIIFYWTPPHFWALALLKQKDYGAAGVPMAPLIWGERHTRDQMLWYLGIMISLSVLPFCTGAFGNFYLISALVVAAPLLFGVIKMRMQPDNSTSTARFVFHYSLLYLALLYVAMVVDLHVFR